jgi:hypothetical protein
VPSFLSCRTRGNGVSGLRGLLWAPGEPAGLFASLDVMAWVAMDRTVRDVERFNFQAPLEPWRKVRDRIHATICGLGFDSDGGGDCPVLKIEVSSTSPKIGVASVMGARALTLPARRPAAWTSMSAHSPQGGAGEGP